MRPRIYDDRFARQYGYWRLVISDVVEKYLACGILKHGHRGGEVGLRVGEVG